ncbi:MAG: hypothetical protein M1819_003608 [Sarea resinae]|nr:MAG: hypothetical protein M1819_003608 [Sarea resinae]
MLAARDQENLVHGQQTAAASKPLNQGIRQLAPKTPGNKVPKTPFKHPLNDENAVTGFGKGKTVLRTKGKENENLVTGKKGGDKNAFVTPLGTRNRAPLGAKTTNVKAKVFQTPAPPADNGPEKSAQRSTARRTKSKISHTDLNQLDSLGDKDELEERDIEYMPPRPKGKLFLCDRREFKGANMTRGWFETYCNPVGDDGLTLFEREEQERQAKHEKAMDEMIQKAVDEMPLLGINIPEYPGEETAEEAARKAEVERQRKKPPTDVPTQKRSTTSTRKPLTSKGPSMNTSRNAAAALSQGASAVPKARPAMTSAKSKLPSSLIGRGKRTPPPTNPSSMRHSAATAASKTTLGYSHGRSASASLKKATSQHSRTPSSHSSEATLSPAMYSQERNTPEIGSERWKLLREAGAFDDDDCEDLEPALRGIPPTDLFRAEAEQEFVLTL